MKSFAILIVIKLTGKGDTIDRRGRDVLSISVGLSLYLSVGWKEKGKAQRDV